MRFLKSGVLCMLLAIATGCGNNEVSMKITVPPASELLKAALSDVAAKGEPVGSRGVLLQQYVEQLSKVDDAKAKALSPMVDAIMALKAPAKIKAKANEMLKLL